MKRMKKLEQIYTSRTTKDYDAMTLSELRNERANMVGWLEVARRESTAGDGIIPPPTVDMPAVEFALKQVEQEICWRVHDGTK